MPRIEYVERIVEVPQIQHRPVEQIVEVEVPQIQTQVVYKDVEVPVVQHRQVPVERRVEVPVPVLQTQYALFGRCLRFECSRSHAGRGMFPWLNGVPFSASRRRDVFSLLPLPRTQMV